MLGGILVLINFVFILSLLYWAMEHERKPGKNKLNLFMWTEKQSITSTLSAQKRPVVDPNADFDLGKKYGIRPSKVHHSSAAGKPNIFK